MTSERAAVSTVGFLASVLVLLAKALPTARGLLSYALAILLLGVGSTTQAQAQRQRDRLPPIVQHIRSEIRESCGSATFRAGFIKQANFSPDGKPDYILDYRAVDCAAGASWFCGSGGCSVDVVISEGETYRKTSFNFRQFRLISQPTGDILSVALHGSACGRMGAGECEQLYFWRRGRFSSQN